jgi:hypothetical protein
MTTKTPSKESHEAAQKLIRSDEWIFEAMLPAEEAVLVAHLLDTMMLKARLSEAHWWDGSEHKGDQRVTAGDLRRKRLAEIERQLQERGERT